MKKAEKQGYAGLPVHANEKPTMSPVVLDDDTRCGFGSCTPDPLQIFARIGAFVGVYSISGLLTSTLTIYVNSQVSMLEKQFGFSSAETGLLMSFNDIGYLCVVILAGYVARKVHIPRGLGLSTMLYGLCGILCAMPYFLQDPATFDLDASPMNGTRSSPRSKVPLCLNDTDGLGQLDCSVSEETGVVNAVTEQLSVKKMAFTLIAIGMTLQGVGKSFRGPFLTLYIDDAVDKKKTGFYMGIIIGTAIFGPALGYVLGGLFSKIYVTLESVDINPRDPRWIGAWWLGFIVFGILSLFFSFPIMAFPRYLRSSGRQRELEMTSKQQDVDKKSTEKKAASDTIWNELKEFAFTVVRILKNPVYMVFAVSTIINMMGLAGSMSFMPKYLAAQYTIPLWHANIIMSLSTILAVSIGSFIGGVMTRKIQMTPLTTVKLLLLFYVVNTLAIVSGFFLGCEQPQLVGDSGRSEISPLYERLPSCVEDCACQDVTYFPICGDDGRSYFSPCHAGCTRDTFTDFYNCTCIPTGQATAGLCDQGCYTNMYAYAVFTFVGKLFTAFKIVPSFIANLRCVEERDRAAASAFAGFLTSALAWMPGPVIFGLIIDDACVLWKYTCGERQSCQLYDIVYFRNSILGFNTIASILATLVLSSLYFYFRIKGYTEWRGGKDAKAAERQKTKEVIVNKKIYTGLKETDTDSPTV